MVLKFTKLITVETIVGGHVCSVAGVPAATCKLECPPLTGYNNTK